MYSVCQYIVRIYSIYYTYTQYIKRVISCNYVLSSIDMFTGRMGNIKEALKLITEQLQDVDKVNY